MRGNGENPVPPGRLWVYRIGALSLGTILGLICVEILLQVSPGVLPRRIQNGAHGRYGVIPGDLYYVEPISGVRFMFREDHVRAFWNGYWWEHCTDRFGFRNPDDLRKRDVLLVGDSLIYGHGVEEEETVAHVLRTRYGRAAYNLSRQGACLYDHYVNLRLFMKDLDPRVVVLFFFVNDYSELESRPRVLREMPELQFDYRRIRPNVDARGVRREGPLDRLVYGLATVRLARRVLEERQFLPQLFRWVSTRGKGKIRKNPEGWRFTAPILVPERLRAISRYYERILLELKNACDVRGIELKLVNIRVGTHEGMPVEQAEARAHDFLRGIAQKLDLPFFDTYSLFRDCAECALPHDGHLSPAGHARLAKFLSEEVLSPDSSGE